MDILSNKIEFSESNLKVFSSVLGKMVERYFEDSQNKLDYEKQKPQLTLEILQLERKREIKGGVYESNQRKKN